MAYLCGRSGRRVALDVFCVVTLLALLCVWLSLRYPENVSKWLSVSVAKLGLSEFGRQGDASEGSLGAYVPGLLYSTPYLGGEDKWLDAR